VSNSTVVCNFQITKKLETFCINRRKPGGRFWVKVFVDFFSLYGLIYLNEFVLHAEMEAISSNGIN
jgi:hypothetical protein